MMQTATRKFIRHGGPYNKVAITFPKEGRTKQSFTQECDINNIMAKYQKTGALAHVNKHQAQYGFATSEDFSQAMRTVTLAQQMFDDLPSSIRNKFNNNPGAFLDFVQDDENIDEARTLGLTKTPPKDEPNPDKQHLEPEPPEKKTEPEPKKE